MPRGGSAVKEWPRSHADNPRLSSGGVAGDYSEAAVENLYVRCYDCLGAAEGCESCEGTGFDWTDTVSARLTLRTFNDRQATT